MKYFFEAVLLGYFVATLANSNLTTKPAQIAGPNCRKIGSMFSELKRQLAELKEEIREMKVNQSGDSGEKGL